MPEYQQTPANTCRREPHDDTHSPSTDITNADRHRLRRSLHLSRQPRVESSYPASSVFCPLASPNRLPTSRFSSPKTRLLQLRRGTATANQLAPSLASACPPAARPLACAASRPKYFSPVVVHIPCANSSSPPQPSASCDSNGVCLVHSSPKSNNVSLELALSLGFPRNKATAFYPADLDIS